MKNKEMEKLICDLAKIEALSDKLRANDQEYKEIPFEYRPILNALGKIISTLSWDTRLMLRKRSEKKRIKLADLISKVYDIVFENELVYIKQKK